jgi:hypothetical protein
MSECHERGHGGTDCGKQSHYAPGHQSSRSMSYVHAMCVEHESIGARTR